MLAFDDRFESVKEMTENIDMGLDIEFDLLGTRYCIGRYGKGFFISWHNGDRDEIFPTGAKLVNGFMLEGKPLKDYIGDIRIHSM